MEEERATGPRGPEVSSPAEEVRAGLVALGVEMGNLTGRFAATTGLHQTDVRALWLPAAQDAPRTAGELGARLDLSSGAATRTVDRLERAGYVEWVRDSDDRRRVCLCLTGEVQAVTSAFFGRVASVVGEAIEDFAESDLAIAARFLSRVHEALLKASIREPDGSPSRQSSPRTARVPSVVKLSRSEGRPMSE